jgi:hypothetical protein
MMEFIESYLARVQNQGFQLDIVGAYPCNWLATRFIPCSPLLCLAGFLAILGEGSVETIAQVATLSYLIYVPRLIPAPQIFIRPSRPEKLETTSGAKVIGVHSGNTGEDIHHVAHALHRGDKLTPNTVSCVRVRENKHARPSIKRFGPLAMLAFMGAAMTCTLLGLSIYFEDG